MVTQAMANQSREIGAPWLRVKRAIESENGAVMSEAGYGRYGRSAGRRECEWPALRVMRGGR